MNRSIKFYFLLAIWLIAFFSGCDSFDEEYLSYIYVKNNTGCLLDIYLNSEFQFSISCSDNIMIIENVSLGYNIVTAFKNETDEEVYSLNIYVYAYNRGYYFIIEEGLCS